MNYNEIHSVEDISDESGEVTEPVTLTEAKNYLRLNGLGVAGANISVKEPLYLTIATSNFVQSGLLQGDDVRIISVEREGLGYNEVDGTPGNRQFDHDPDLGRITFEQDGAGLEIKVVFGLSNESEAPTNFDFDDDLIQMLITGARERLEIFTGCSLIPKRIQAVITNLCGMTSLPAGPVTGDVTATDSEGTEIVAGDIKLVGSKFPDLKLPMQCEMTLTYNAGYSTLPKGLKNAILAEVAYRYENRGDESPDAGICKAAIVLANPYKRASAFA